jgi:hypothetical protein
MLIHAPVFEMTCRLYLDKLAYGDLVDRAEGLGAELAVVSPHRAGARSRLSGAAPESSARR